MTAVTDQNPSPTTSPAPATPRRTRGPRRPRKLALLGAVMIAVVVTYSVAFPFLGLYDAYGQDLAHAFTKPFTDPSHLLGTDALGRDVASRLALAGRVTLSIVLLIIVVNSLLGMAIGVVSGYAGGKVDNALMALADVQLALPVMFVLIALAAARGPSVWLMIIVLAATYWVGYARVARGVAITLRGRDFVLAPRIQGASTLWTLRKHVLPNVTGQMLILASSDIGAVILLTSSFDYLGLGVQAPTPSWGLMISEGQKYLRQEPSLALVPGIAIFLVVAGTNLVSQHFTAESAPVSRPRRKGARR